MDAYQLWQATLGQLQLQLAKPTYDTWVKNTQAVSFEDGVLVVGVHSAYAKDWLENRLYSTIQHTVTEIARRTVSLRFVVQRNGSLEQEDVELLDMSEPTSQGTPWRPADGIGSTGLNSK